MDARVPRPRDIDPPKLCHVSSFEFFLFSPRAGYVKFVAAMAERGACTDAVGSRLGVHLKR
jgi:hypothetical protein